MGIEVSNENILQGQQVRKVMIDLTIADLQSAIYAMDSWLDGPGGDSDQDEDAQRVRRALLAFQAIVDGATHPVPERRARHLRLVGPPEEEGG